MAIEKTMKTRIVLTHDEYSALSSKVLKEGEVVLAKVGTTEANGKVSEPIWMMKVGCKDAEGNLQTVANCPWMVAPAADVYEWAKKSSLDANDLPAIPGAKLGLTVTTTGDGNAVTGASWDAATKTITLTKGETFATKAEFDAHNHKAADLEDFVADVTKVVNDLGITTEGVEDLNERLADAETAIEGIVGDDGELEIIYGRLDAIDNAETGSVAVLSKALEEHVEDYSQRINTLGNGINEVRGGLQGLESTVSDLANTVTENYIDLDGRLNSLNGSFWSAVDGENGIHKRLDAIDGGTASKTSIADISNTLVSYSNQFEDLWQHLTDSENPDSVDNQLAAKADKATTYTKDEVDGLIAEVQEDATQGINDAATAQAAADEANRKIDTFMGTVESSTEVVDTLEEIIALINSEDAELSEALLNEINGLKAKFNADGKALEAVNADTVDGKHAADFATAAQGAKADATAATVATYGDIVTHNVSEFATSAQGVKADNAAAAIATYGDIVTKNWSDVTGAVADAEGRATQAVTDLANGAVKGNTESIAAINETIGEYGDIVTYDAEDFAVAGHNHDDVYKKIQTAVEVKGAADKTLKVSQDAQGVITTEEVAIAIEKTQVNGLTDSLTGLETLANSKVASVECAEATGLKATNTDGAVVIDFMDDVVFVLDGGTAADL